MQKNTVVTVDLGITGSNVFEVDTDEGQTLLVTHPLAHGLLLRVDKSKVNTLVATVKDSSERCIGFARANKNVVDYNTSGDLEAIEIYYAVRRKLTPRQKQTLANICGVIASVKFNNDIREAMSFITKNSGLLDEFNGMWYNNFKGLFVGKQQITSKKQRSAIFNIAGYVLAELENPMTQTRK